MKNANLPAMPQNNSETLCQATGAPHWMHCGLTKREMFCLHNCVADTGDSELDAIIRKGNHHKAAIAAMRGLLANEAAVQWGIKFQGTHPLTKQAANMADALLAELEKSQ